MIRPHLHSLICTLSHIPSLPILHPPHQSFVVVVVDDDDVDDDDVVVVVVVVKYLYIFWNNNDEYIIYYYDYEYRPMQTPKMTFHFLHSSFPSRLYQFYSLTK